MSNVILDRMTAAEAKDLIRRCVEEGTVIAGPHFRKALADESFTYVDVEYVLGHGNIYKPPEPDIKTGEWKYRIEGHIEDGQWIAVIFSFKVRDRAFLITVFSVESMRKR